jgi:hypothetical protein
MAYVFSSTKLAKRENRFCLQVRGLEGKRVEMAQKMYAHMNK